MKVLNYTTSYFAIILLIIISIWAGLFYYAMLDEIYDSIDDGLDNQKGLIIQKASVDSSILRKSTFEEGDYSIQEIPFSIARDVKDIYLDTMMYMQNEQDFEPVRLLRTYFHHNGKYYQMQVVTSMVEEDDLTAELLYGLLWLYLGLVASILILNNYLLKRIWRPFNHLVKQIRNFKLEKPNNIEVKKTNIDEFKLLNDTVQRLLQGNIDSYTSQKHFIENASHELQTPLAISINKLEALAEKNTLSEDELSLLSSALNNLERLTRLNKSLLLLSRIENKQYLVEEEINLNTLIKRVASDFEDQLAYDGMILHIEEKDVARINMNRDLASIMITNLVKNAIVHNHRDGFINILISKDHIRIDNTGTPQPLDPLTIFKRFNSTHQSKSSTGLGLSIVKAICDLYAFQLSYDYNKRHMLTVRFL